MPTAIKHLKRSVRFVTTFDISYREHARLMRACEIEECTPEQYMHLALARAIHKTLA